MCNECKSDGMAEQPRVRLSSPRNTLSDAVAKEKAAIEAVTADLNFNLEMLHDTIGNLTDKLSPVLADYPANESPSQDQAFMGTSPLYLSLCRQLEMIRHATTRLTDVRNRVEL